MMVRLYINDGAISNIIKNQKTVEIRKKNKYTDSISSTVTFASSRNTVTKNIKKIIIVNDIISYINSIDISLTGWNSKEDYINKLKSLYKKMPNTFVAIYLS
jgi:hypothetical protein